MTFDEAVEIVRKAEVAGIDAEIFQEWGIRFFRSNGESLVTTASVRHATKIIDEEKTK